MSLSKVREAFSKTEMQNGGEAVFAVQKIIYLLRWRGAISIKRAKSQASLVRLRRKKGASASPRRNAPGHFADFRTSLGSRSRITISQRTLMNVSVVEDKTFARPDNEYTSAAASRGEKISARGTGRKERINTGPRGRSRREGEGPRPTCRGAGLAFLADTP